MPIENEMSFARQLSRAWNEFQAQLALLNEDQLLTHTIVGDWSAKDLMAHIAFWDRQAVERLEALAAGRPVPRLDAAQIDTINRDAVDEAAAVPLDDVRRDMLATHAELARLLPSAPAEAPERIRFLTLVHYQEHTGDIEKALGAAANS